jgi:D-alanyl-D-alanine carboxypeptidase
MTSPYQVEVVREAVPYIASWVGFQRRLLRIPGVQMAIRVGDEVVLSQAFGYANEPSSEPLRTDHLFRIASQSKTFTATAIIQLVARSKIRLDDPISQWVPELSSAAIAGVTVRELLGHQAGVIRDGIDADFWELRFPFPDRQELIKLCNDDGKVYQANEHYKYSNVGYSLLGMAIEAASGKSYHDYVRDYIIDPLGLTNTGPEFDADRKDQYATGHTDQLDGTEPRETFGDIDTRGMAPAGGLYSTAEDLTRYGAAHFFGNQELITDAGKRLIQRSETTVVSHGTEIGVYGLGMELVKIGQREWVGHTGGFLGQTGETCIDPLGKVVVSVLTNCEDGPAPRLAEVAIKMLDLAHAAPDTPPPPEGVDIGSFTGRFASLAGVFDIAVLGGRLVGLAAASPDPTVVWQELQVIDENTLQLIPDDGFGPVGERVVFTRDESGAVQQVRSNGTSRWPLEVFRARRSAQIAAAADLTR